MMTRHPARFADCANFPQAARLAHKQIARERTMTIPAADSPTLAEYEQAVNTALAVWYAEMAAARERVVARLRRGRGGTPEGGIDPDYRRLFADAIETGDYTTLEI